MLECSTERPWGLHPSVTNDKDCPRCGWTAPGPLGDARLEATQASGAGEALGWDLIDGGAALAA